MNKDTKTNPLKPDNLLDSWIKEKKRIRIYNNVGGKIEGNLKAIGRYDITLETGGLQLVIVHKASIFYIEGIW